MVSPFKRVRKTRGTEGRLRRRSALNGRVATLVLSIVAFFAASMLACIPLMLFFQLLDVDAEVAELLCTSLSTIIVSLGMLSSFQRHFKDTFDGLFQWTWKGLLLVLPSLAFAAANLLELTTDASPNPIAPVLVMALAPGIGEEIAFRAIPASNWMRTDGSEDGIVHCVVATSLAFSLIHAANLTAGAALSSTLLQLAYAFALGIFFCAVMLRTGSLWPTVVAHTIIDATGMLFMDMSDNGVITEELTLDPVVLIPVAILVAIAAIGLYLVRPSCRPEIVDLWDKKWGRA